MLAQQSQMGRTDAVDTAQLTGAKELSTHHLLLVKPSRLMQSQLMQLPTRLLPYT